MIKLNVEKIAERKLEHGTTHVIMSLYSVLMPKWHKDEKHAT